MDRIICCNGNRTTDTPFDKLQQCPICQNYWHVGCYLYFLKGKDCCPVENDKIYITSEDLSDE